MRCGCFHLTRHDMKRHSLTGNKHLLTHVGYMGQDTQCEQHEDTMNTGNINQHSVNL